MAKEAKKKSDDGCPSSLLANAHSKFSPFLAANPASTIEEVKGRNSANMLRIKKPWGDASVAIIIPNDDDALAEALNNTVLTERLTAVWHSDTKGLEIIWTALRLSAGQKEIDGRKFQFEFAGTVHDCEFGASSSRLVEITKNTFPQGMSETNHRNIHSFFSYSAMDEKSRVAYGVEKPKSFWIYNVDWDEANTIELIQNLNFYLTYYDDASPTVVIHEPPPAQNHTSRRTRYIHGGFPTLISARGLNANLLSFWSAADTGNAVMRFILYYRIIEYAASHYLDADIKIELRKILSTPHITSKMSDSIEKIIDIVDIKN